MISHMSDQQPRPGRIVASPPTVPHTAAHALAVEIHKDSEAAKFAAGIPWVDMNAGYRLAAIDRAEQMLGCLQQLPESFKREVLRDLDGRA